MLGDVYPPGCFGVGVDINYKALCATKSNTEGKSVNLLHSSLMSSFCTRPIFDVIFCNPPYVPSEELQTLKRQCQPIDLAWAGGVNGREVIDEIIKNGINYLVTGGVLYLLIIQQNDPDSIIEYARELGYLCVVRF